jgi:hypothetical protein
MSWRGKSGRERPVSSLPGWLLALLCVALIAQVAWHAADRGGAPLAEDLPPAPAGHALRVAASGERAAFARASMLWLQAFDSRAGNTLPYQRLDYARLSAWLSAILSLDPRSLYPLFAAARVYAENADPEKMRRMLEFVHSAFPGDPNLRWPALAHAALLAKHRLQDLPLARRYAADLQRLTTDPGVPLWAKQMEVFILEDMDELEAARVMLGGLLAAGRIKDEGERRFLEDRLKALEAKIRSSKGQKR